MYLGIDQSLTSTGVAVVTKDQEHLYTGAVTPKKLTGVHRLSYIREELRDVCAGFPSIKYAALEGYSVGSVNRPFALGEVGAVVQLVLHDAGIPFLVVAPKSLKLFVTGSGDAKKEDMQKAVKAKWGLDFDHDDICDAFGLAQLARSFHMVKGSTRAELEVLKKLRNTDKKIALVSASYPALSI